MKSISAARQNRVSKVFNRIGVVLVLLLATAMTVQAQTPPTKTICLSARQKIKANMTTPGTAPYTYVWAVTSGESSRAGLPADIVVTAPTLDPDSIIEVRPTAPGTYEYTVTITDAMGCQVQKVARIVVNPRPSLDALITATTTKNSLSVCRRKYQLQYTQSPHTQTCIL